MLLKNAALVVILRLVCESVFSACQQRRTLTIDPDRTSA